MEKNEKKKISKGYRLSKETHDMIKQIQNMLKVNADNVLNKACSSFLIEIQKKGNQE